MRFMKDPIYLIGKSLAYYAYAVEIEYDFPSWLFIANEPVMGGLYAPQAIVFWRTGWDLRM